MQIHEITLPQLNEGIGDTLRTIGKNLKTSADFALRGDEKAGEAMLKQQTDAYINSLIPQWKTEWAKVEPGLQKTYSTGAGQKAAERPAPGQMPANVASSEQGQKMRQAYGEPKGGIQDIKSDLEEAQPQDPALAAKMADEYVKRFQEWSNRVLSTRESNTRQEIPANKFQSQLNDYAKKIEDAYKADNTVAVDQAVKNYMMAQVAMVQAEAKEIRDRYLASIRAGERVAVPGISKDQLDKLAQTVEKRGETVRPTGSDTIDSLLRAAGMIR